MGVPATRTTSIAVREGEEEILKKEQSGSHTIPHNFIATCREVMHAYWQLTAFLSDMFIDCKIFGKLLSDHRANRIMMVVLKIKISN